MLYRKVCKSEKREQCTAQTMSNFERKRLAAKGALSALEQILDPCAARRFVCLHHELALGVRGCIGGVILQYRSTGASPLMTFHVSLRGQSKQSPEHQKNEVTDYLTISMILIYCK